jgi:NAD(P)-dependent dehydrogenase (short-subunit alcohol dehydrogenase family)
MHETLEHFRDTIVASNPLKRIGEPSDMAGVAIYLASKAGAYLTGAIIPVDGGMSTWRGDW